MADELKRVAILGTAPTWQQCPWQDPTLEIWGLNDAYVLGYPRVTAWFDIHNPKHMTFHERGKPVPAEEAPIGSYLRPHGHLEWLASRPYPVYVQQARKDWPTSVTFPKDAVLAYWATFWPWRVDRQGTVSPGKDYEVSTPAWMYMWAVMEGYTEIHIYGVHLATEWEYLQQRPNLEFLIGVAAGLGVKTVLPSVVPICQAKFQYAYEPKADLPHQAIIRKLEEQAQWQHVLDRDAKAVPWYRPGRRRDLQAQARHLKLERMDLSMQADRLKAASR
jgi:hypothetical protein